jgi:hypothetical protein
MTSPQLASASYVLPWRLCFALVLMLFMCSCTQVEPWQRGTLAKPQMSSNPRPLQNKLRSHVQNSREATSAGDVAAGGGCGCY